MRGLVFAAVLLAAPLPAAAAPAADPMAALIGNTLVVGSGDRATYFVFKADHTFTGRVPLYEPKIIFRGLWSMQGGDKLCLTLQSPRPAVPQPVCDPLSVRRVGDTWTTPQGQPSALVRGIVAPPPRQQTSTQPAATHN